MERPVPAASTFAVEDEQRLQRCLQSTSMSYHSDSPWTTTGVVLVCRSEASLAASTPREPPRESSERDRSAVAQRVMQTISNNPTTADIHAAIRSIC